MQLSLMIICLYCFRNGFLAVLCRDSSVVKLYDIRHSMTGTDEFDPVIIERNVQRKCFYRTCL